LGLCAALLRTIPVFSLDKPNNQVALESPSIIVNGLKKRARNRPSEWREGQAAFNYLFQDFPELAIKIRGTNLDPFHQENI